MTIRNYIPIDKDNLPERFEFDFGEETFIFEFKFNERMGYFTASVFDEDEDAIVVGEKLIYGEPLWNDLNNELLPIVSIVPFDESGNETEITFDNFGETVFLFIDDIALDGEDDGGVADGD
ncbi:hypothetical protein EQG49_12850 [Periweissella cryptocerci]|uniref:Cyanophage baseplate Pam3 plug gp18 domain-containing protein n=1 Tax=Periweissella cryptocerci TaxID=2506420 RepID=A0A4V1AJ01_9LACO|nr:hypothetical protein [Periweissella cryptocerci]QBO37285.1 hypothetical protein EQG49_12850 [Periweissella cryptocerci]